MKEISLKITQQETNLILESLQKRPFCKVHELVGKIINQAQVQLSEEDKKG